MRLLADPRTPPPVRSELELSLGQALHGLKRRSEAFAAWTWGKSILRELYARRAASRPGETAKADALTAALAVLPPDLWAQPPAEAPPETPREGEAQVHVFLVGFPRSGATLLEQILAGHPRV
jgi:hypothetical protein